MLAGQSAFSMFVNKTFLFYFFLLKHWKVKALRSLDAHGSYLQDFTEILDVCMIPITKFQIIQETGMSMRHLHFCLKYLLKQHLVRYHYRKKTYETTDKGLRIKQLLPHN